jgi:hypothetical protein
VGLSGSPPIGPVRAGETSLMRAIMDTSDDLHLFGSAVERHIRHARALRAEYFRQSLESFGKWLRERAGATRSASRPADGNLPGYGKGWSAWHAGSADQGVFGLRDVPVSTRDHACQKWVVLA